MARRHSVDPARLRMLQLEPRTAAKTAAPRRQRPTFGLIPELPFRTELTPLLERSGSGPLPPRFVPVRSHSLPFVRRCPILGRVRSRIRVVGAIPAGRRGRRAGRAGRSGTGAPISRSPCPGTGGHRRPGAAVSPAGLLTPEWAFAPVSRGYRKGLGRRRRSMEAPGRYRATTRGGDSGDTRAGCTDHPSLMTRDVAGINPSGMNRHAQTASGSARAHRTPRSAGSGSSRAE